MVHGPPTETKKETSEGYNTRVGLIMFVIYTAIYLAFVFICVLNPKIMSMKVGSLNLAVVYGFSLIIIAVIQALIYNLLCSKREKGENHTEGKTDK